MTHVSPMLYRYCKRGHLRTKESTFARKTTCNGKEYTVRECRICHSMRNTKESKTGRRNDCKWLRFTDSQS